MRSLAAVLAFAALPAAAEDSAEIGYAKPELLADQPAVVKLWSEQKPVVLLDVRSQAKFDAGHVPTARRIDVGEWKKAFGDGSDAAAWGQRIGALGIGADTTVIVYDETFTPGAARAWWLLKYWGVGDARVLNGGWRGWHPPKVSFPAPERGPTEFVAKPHPERLRTFAQMKKLSTSGGERIIDARSLREAIQTGMISPLTQQCDWATLVDSETGRLKPAPELAKLLKLNRPEGMDHLPMVAYCQSGGRASVTAFALELMGVEKVANYWGSWGEWSRLRDASPPPSE